MKNRPPTFKPLEPQNGRDTTLSGDGGWEDTALNPV